MNWKSFASRQTRPRPIRLRLEALEDRSLPSTITFTAPTDGKVDNLLLRISATKDKLELLDNGVVVQSQPLSGLTSAAITGSNTEVDTLTLDYSNGFFTVPVNFNGGSGAGDQIIVSADVNYTLTNTNLSVTGGGPVSLTSVESASLTGGAGNNTIDASAFTGTTTLDGGAGNDTLKGGSGVDTMLGGAGNDTLISVKGGNDVINGGIGDDVYSLDPGSTITVTDDGGNDTIDFSPIMAGGVNVNLGGTSGTITEATNSNSIVNVTGSFETLIGTNFNDTIIASNTTVSSLSQVFNGLGGNDTFTDQSTADVLAFHGGPGNSFYNLNPGSTITVTDDGGTDTIDFGAVTAGGVTVVLGDTSGTASVSNSTGTVVGTVNITGTMENVNGTTFADSITGNSFNNILNGRSGNDTLVGGGGNDTFILVPGSDKFLFTSGDGIDTLDFSGANFGISLNLGSNGLQPVDSAGNRIQLNGTFENVIGTRFDDVINGNSADNVLIGGGGDDRLNGQAGRDVLIGGEGSDRLTGNADEDIMIGGTTSYDNNVAALLAIQAEWSRTDLAYVDRVNHIMNGGGLNDPYLLNTSSVFADGAVDTLTGGQQLDLFFIDAFDTITDLNKKGETVVTVS